MQQKHIEKICRGFAFYLQTTAQLQISSVQTNLRYLRPLLQAEVLQNRQKFLEYCLKRQADGISNRTLNHEMTCVKHYLQYTKQKWQPLNYFPHPKTNQLSPTLQEIQQFLQLHTTPAMDMFWDLHIHCGTRPSEVLNLRLCDLDLAHHCFHPAKTKTNDGKPIIVPPLTQKNLQKYLCNLQNITYLFPGRFGNRPLTLSAVRHDCEKRLKMMHCEHHYHPHSFRHSYITLAIAQGMPVQYVQRLVRHTNIQTTLNYYDNSVDFVYQAASIHPLFVQQLTPDLMVEQWISYINSQVDYRFDQKLLSTAFAALRRAGQNRLTNNSQSCYTGKSEKKEKCKRKVKCIKDKKHLRS